ncbi:MAG: hypothetical protein IT428_27440 [Planctomycetaceae bacterium]|nr:hypothetical protein [Planctomycetaceae bacterium]
MAERTVRELAGEIWSEVNHEWIDAAANGSPLATLDINAFHRILDILMGVLARHIDARIINDEDFPVVPLKKSFDDS